MTSLYKTIIRGAEVGKPASCLVTNLSNAGQALGLIQERLAAMKETFVVLNGDSIADDILLRSDTPSTTVRIAVAGVDASTVDLTTGATSVAEAFDPALARSSFVAVIFNKSTPYAAVISEFVDMASQLRPDNRNIHCVFLQNGTEKQCS